MKGMAIARTASLVRGSSNASACAALVKLPFAAEAFDEPLTKEAVLAIAMPFIVA